MKKLISVALAILIFQGCLVKYGEQTKSNYTSTSNSSYENSSGKIDLFFEGVTVNRQFEQIGYVEATGSETSTTNELLNYLKYKAYENGADGVINVKKETVIRETGYLFDNDYDEIYSAPSFTGIAIKYTDYKTSSEHVKYITDTSFVKYVDEVEREDSQKIENGVIWSFVIGLVSIIAVIIKN